MRSRQFVVEKRHRWRSARWFIIIGFASAAPSIGEWAGLSLQNKASLPGTTPPPPATAAPGPTENEAYRWRPVAIGGGGFMVGMSMDSAGKTIVARTDVHGAYIWERDLDQWVQLATAPAMPKAFRRPAGMDGGVFSLVVAPTRPQRLYMATHGTIFRSDDRGKSWQEPDGGPFPMRFASGSNFLKYEPALAVDPTNPDLAFVGTGFDGLFRTGDGGRTWARVSSLPVPTGQKSGSDVANAPPALVWFVPARAQAGQIWTLIPGLGMFASRDKGANFRPLASRGEDRGPAPRTLNTGEFAPDGTFYGADAERRTVWRYRHGAWTDLVQAGALPPVQYVTLAVDPRNGQVLAFEHNGRAHRSADGGESWSNMRTQMRVGEKDPPWLRVANHSFFATSQVRFDPVVPHRLWIAAGTGMFHADVPPGAWTVTWISRTRGIEELVTNDVVQQVGRAPLFAAWDFGIHVKSDLDVFSTSFGPKERMIIAAQQLALTPADPNFVVTNASDTRNCCAEDGDAVLAGYSEDAGRTWHRFATLPRPPGTDAKDPWRMAWGMIAVSSGDRDNIIWAPSLNRAPFYTKDRGRSWTRVSFPGEKLPFTGTHPAKHLQRKVLVADPVRGGTFYLAHSGTPTNPQLAGLWVTHDAGATWTMRSRGEIAPRSNHAAKLRAVPGREGQLFFTSAVAGTQESGLRQTMDGGATWKVLPHIDRVDDLAFGKAAAGKDDPTIYLSGYIRGNYGIWRSIDAGANWSRIARYPIGRLDRVVVLGADPDVFGRVYIGWQGSGWTYGEPARCRPVPFQSLVPEECILVR
jgi:photosystem II stability/assembly factor-like uncharacterized protein